MKKNNFLVLSIFLIFVILFSFQCSAYMKSSVQGISPGILSGGFASSGGQWIPDRTMCEAGQDFAVQIEPFGCQPAIVRSDLLEEQNTPVLCQLSATKINPLLDVNAIESISFAGRELPNSISGVGFYPAQAALGVTGDLNSPVLNNIGYAVIVLKKQPNSSAMPDSVSGNLTATLKYDIKNAYGIGDTSFYLPEISDDKVWESSMKQYGFWNSKAYLRADTVTTEEAKISIYTDTTKLKSISLDKGQQSDEIFLPGFDCFVGVKLKLDDLVSPDIRATLNINGDTIQLVEKEKFLENKCTLVDITKRGLTKKAEISCKEDEGTSRFTLVLTPRVKLNIGGEEKEYSVGDYLYEGTTVEKNWVTKKEGEVKKYVYLGYVGTKGDSERLEDLYVILVSTSSNPTRLSDTDIARYASKAETLYSNIYRDKSKLIEKTLQFSTEWGNAIRNLLEKEVNLKYIPYQTDAIWNSANVKELANNNFVGKEIKVIEFASPVNSALEQGGTSSNYYKNAAQDYSKVVSAFAAEKDPMYPYGILGEESFVSHIKLASFLNQKGDVETLCKEFKKSYPSSTKMSEVKGICDNPSEQSSATSSSREISVNGRQKIITLEDIREPSFEEYGVYLKVTLPDKSSQDLYLTKDKTNYIYEGNPPRAVQYAQLLSITKDTISMNINRTAIGLAAEAKTLYQSNTVTLTKGKPDAFGTAYIFEIISINDKKNAKVSVTPTINRAQTEANFSFYIGIEKRSIELSPEKTKEMIESLNKTIADWKNIDEKLGKVVEGMKGACLATGLALTMKNFASNVGGKSIARQEIMLGENGWNKKCVNAVSTKTLNNKIVNYKTVEECIMANSEQIDNDVNGLYQIMQEQDKTMKILQEGCPKIKEGFLQDTVIDTKCVQGKYSLQIAEELEKSSSNSFPIKVGDKTIYSSDILTLIKTNKVSLEDMRKIQLYSKAKGETGLSDLAMKELNTTFVEIYTANQNEIMAASAASKVSIDQTKIANIFLNKDNKVASYAGLKYEEVLAKTKIDCNMEGEDNSRVDCAALGITKSTPVQYFTTDSGKFYLGFLKLTGSKYFIETLYDVNANTIVTGTDAQNIKNRVSFELTNEESYKGRGYKSSLGSSVEGPMLRCYETEPYKSVPAITPVNTKDGWYVSISQTLPAFGNIGSVDSSGRVMSYYLCNVWINGIEENRGGDDKCTMINLGTGQSLQVGGLDATQSKKLIDEAGKAVETAQKICKTGKAGQTFTLGVNAKGIKMGSPAVDMPDMQCTNFMSPSDCKILFNVCDPVVCPSSRCNYGGKYPVKDVIQSGIIGSVLLCLPNFVGFSGGDVYIPVCLSGIKAGIEGLLSVFESYRDCLQESLDTGQMTGICDEIYSVHLCEFFWRQATPFAKMIIPKTIELIMGQSTKGGGEYLSVQNAWTAAGQSVDYFAQYYAAESYATFKSRVVQEVTDAVCKTYISGAYPDGGKIIDTLTKADSPPQYTGRFDEIPFTTITNPAISQYKVFYHIFAGKDSRVYYQVYLSEGTESSYYQDTVVNRLVAQGYIAAGGTESDTVDFTAVSGYKKMCIVINGEKDCGFKQASSSFALDYIADQYVKEQANETGIASESDCVSGTSSAWSLASISLEGAASELVSPQLYNRGIIRICANENPGSATDKDSTKPRWVSVGNCGKKELKCWLDTESVKDAVNFNSTAQAIINDTTSSFLEQMIKEGKYLSDNDFKNSIAAIDKLIEKKDFASIITSINSIINKVLMNAQKGKLYLLRGYAYGELAKQGYTAEIKKADETATTTTTETVTSQKCTAYSTAVTELSRVMTYGTETEQNELFAEKFLGFYNSNYITEAEYSNFLQFIGTTSGNKNVLDTLESMVASCAGTTIDTEKIDKCTSYSAAIKELSEVLTDLTSKYSDGSNKEFVDALYRNKLITEAEYTNIHGGTWYDWNLEENMQFVLDLLNKKYNNLCKGDSTTGATTPVTGSHGSALNSFAVDTNILNKISTDYGEHIKLASTTFSVEENLIKSIIYVESEGNLNKISETNAMGLMQLKEKQSVEDMISSTGKCYSKCTNYYGAYWETDPKTNIMMGTCYLACIRDVYKVPTTNDDWTNWITSYNAGPTKFASGGNCYNKKLEECSELVTEQKEYAGKVLKVYQTLTNIPQTGVTATGSNFIENLFNKFVGIEVSSGSNSDGNLCKNNCFDAIKCAWEEKGCRLSGCIYSAVPGKTYDFNGNTVTMTSNSGGSFVVVSTGTNCETFGREYEPVLNSLQAGDVLSIIYDEIRAHSVIFIGWENRENNIAKVFEWIKKDSTHFYRYNSYDLSENKNTVFRVWHLKCGQQVGESATPTTTTTKLSATLKYLDQINLELKVNSPFVCDHVNYSIYPSWGLSFFELRKVTGTIDQSETTNKNLFVKKIKTSTLLNPSFSQYVSVECQNKNNENIIEEITFGPFDISASSNAVSKDAQQYATFNYLEESNLFELRVGNVLCNKVHYEIYSFTPSSWLPDALIPETRKKYGEMTLDDIQNGFFVKTFSLSVSPTIDKAYVKFMCWNGEGKILGDVIKVNLGEHIFSNLLEEQQYATFIYKDSNLILSIVGPSCYSVKYVIYPAAIYEKLPPGETRAGVISKKESTGIFVKKINAPNLVPGDYYAEIWCFNSQERLLAGPIESTHFSWP